VAHTRGRGRSGSPCSRRPDLILLDILLGGRRRKSTCWSRLRAEPETREVPVIACTSLGSARLPAGAAHQASASTVSSPSRSIFACSPARSSPHLRARHRRLTDSGHRQDPPSPGSENSRRSGRVGDTLRANGIQRDRVGSTGSPCLLFLLGPRVRRPTGGWKFFPSYMEAWQVDHNPPPTERPRRVQDQPLLGAAADHRGARARRTTCDRRWWRSA